MPEDEGSEDSRLGGGSSEPIRPVERPPEPTRPITRPSRPTRPMEPPPGAVRTTAPPHPPPRPRPLPLGRLVLGALLLASGILWLLGVLDVIDVSLRAVLSLALIATGIGLLLGARSGGHGGLVALGIVLVAFLTLLSSFNIRIEGGVGDRTERPTTVAELKDEYRLGVGQLTVDLSDFAPQARTMHFEAAVGIGRLVIVLPDGLPVRVHGTAGTGQVTLFGKETNGFDVDVIDDRGEFKPDSPRMEVEAEVGLGEIDVRIEKGR